MGILSIIVSVSLLVLAVCFIPCLIVMLWRKRSRWSLAIAVSVLFLTFAIPTTIIAYLNVVQVGPSDRAYAVGAYIGALFVSLVCTAVLCPVILLVQWLARRKYKLTYTDDAKITLFD